MMLYSVCVPEMRNGLQLLTQLEEVGIVDCQLNCTGRKLYFMGGTIFATKIVPPGTILVAKSVPALPKVYRVVRNGCRIKCSAMLNIHLHALQAGEIDTQPSSASLDLYVCVPRQQRLQTTLSHSLQGN